MVFRVTINPEILIWAREVAGFEVDEAAARIDVSAQRLSDWEQGVSSPTARQLRLAGKAYRRPAAFFYLEEPPQRPAELTDFRLVSGASPSGSPEFLYEIRRARSRRSTALELLSEMGEPPIEFNLPFDSEDEPAVIAGKIRDALRVSQAAQMGWRDHYEALREWIKSVESIGVLVCQFSGVDVQEVRGFSIDERPLPVVAMNGRDSPRGRIFTLLHELSHVVLQRGGLCDLHDDQITDSDIEPLCNWIAGESLVPSDTLLSQNEVVSNSSAIWSDNDLEILANRFMVSREVILRRLLILGRSTQNFYRTKRKQFLEEYASRKAHGFIEYFRRVLRDNGLAYTSIVMNAFNSDVITDMEASRFLGDIKLKHVDSIQHELGVA